MFHLLNKPKKVFQINQLIRVPYMSLVGNCFFSGAPCAHRGEKTKYIREVCTLIKKSMFSFQYTLYIIQYTVQCEQCKMNKNK